MSSPKFSADRLLQDKSQIDDEEFAKDFDEEFDEDFDDAVDDDLLEFERQLEIDAGLDVEAGDTDDNCAVGGVPFDDEEEDF